MEDKILEYPILENVYIDEKELNQYVNMKLDNIINAKIKKYIGQTYEEYIKNYIIINENIECWLWKDIPKNEIINSKIITEKRYDEIINYTNELKSSKIKDKNYYKHIINLHHINPIFDFGIDILAKKNEEYIFIQCKNYKKSISNSIIKSFNCIMNNHLNVNGRLYYSNNLSIRKLNRLKNIDYINIPYNDYTIDNYINEITFNTYTDKSIVQRLRNEYKEYKHKENIKNYIDSKKHNIYEIKDINDYLYSDLKWKYIFDELDEYIKLNNKLPPICNNLYEKINNFINYNENISNKYTEEWKKYKQMNPNIFEN